MFKNVLPSFWQRVAQLVRPWTTPSSFLAHPLSLPLSDRLLAKMSHFTLFAAFLAGSVKREPVSSRQRNGLGHHCCDTLNTIWTLGSLQ